MKFMEAVLEKLFAAIEMLEGEGEPWDMTSRYPTDVYIDLLVIALVKLLEIRGMERAGKDDRFAASVDEGACGAVIRARCFGRNLNLVIRTEGRRGAHEEVPLVTVKPVENKMWQHVTCTYES